MHLADSCIQIDLHCIQVFEKFMHSLNQNHDLGVGSAMLWFLSFYHNQ